MSDMSIGVNSAVPISTTANTQKKEAVTEKSTTEEIKGFVSEHKLLIDGSLLLGASTLAASKIKQTVPFIDQSIKSVAQNGTIVGGVALGAGVAYLANDGVKDLRKGEMTTGLAKVNIAGVGLLGATQLVARSANITSLKNVLTSPNSMTAVGMVAGASLMLDGGNRVAKSESVGGFFAGVGEAVGGGFLVMFSANLNIKKF